MQELLVVSAYAAILVKGAHRRVPTARLFGFVVLADLWAGIVACSSGAEAGARGAGQEPCASLHHPPARP